MLKNKRLSLLFTCAALFFSFAQADWHDTLRCLQNNAKRHATTKRVAAVVGVAALCAIGIGCWWKLRQPIAKSDAQQIQYAYHKNMKPEDGYSDHKVSTQEGYKLFALYYTDNDERALDCLCNNDVTKAQNIVDGFHTVSPNDSESKKAYFAQLFQKMNAVVRTCDQNARLSVGMVFVDDQSKTMYATNIGDIAISNNRVNGWLQNATQAYIGKKDDITSDVQVSARDISGGICGELVIERLSRKLSAQDELKWALEQAGQELKKVPEQTSQELKFETIDNDQDMADVVAHKDVALVVKWW